MEPGLAIESASLALDQPAPPVKRHVIVGVLGGLALLGLYLGILTIVQGFEHALQQAAQLWYWIMLLVVGFGIQAGLFSFIRHELKRRQAQNTASMATSSGVSAGAMVACCAHHLNDVLPALGLAGLSAFLVSYQTFFMLAGVLFNLVGITIMLQTIQNHRLCPVVANWKLDMRRLRHVSLVAAITTLTVVFLLRAFA